MSLASIHKLSVARIKRFGQGFTEAYVTNQHSLVLMHPWIGDSMERDRQQAPAERRFWRPCADFDRKAASAVTSDGYVVANPIAIEDLFSGSCIVDLLDVRTNCMIEFLDGQGAVLKRATFGSQFSILPTSGKHKVFIRQRHGVWLLCLYIDKNNEVPVGTVELVLRLEGYLEGETVNLTLVNIPVVRDMRTESQSPRPRPGIRR